MLYLKSSEEKCQRAASSRDAKEFMQINISLYSEKRQVAFIRAGGHLLGLIQFLVTKI